MSLRERYIDILLDWSSDGENCLLGYATEEHKKIKFLFMDFLKGF